MGKKAVVAQITARIIFENFVADRRESAIAAYTSLKTSRRTKASILSGTLFRYHKGDSNGM